ncbi:MAG: ATP-binding protein [Pyrinomonadaceae bacterium]
MERPPVKLRRRKTPWVIGTLMVVSLASLFILQSTNLWKEFTINSSADLLALYALSSLNFIAFVIFAFIFLRSIIKLMRERRTFELGAQIKSRLLIYFFAVSLLPIVAMAVFSYLFMNRALERWFSQIPQNVITEAREVQRQSFLDRRQKFDESARMIAAILAATTPNGEDLEQIAKAGNLVYLEVRSADQGTIAVFDNAQPDQEAHLAAAISNALTINADDTREHANFEVAVADLPGDKTLILARDPFGDRSVSQIVQNSVSELERLKEQQVTVRQVAFLTLGVLTFLLLFASSWIAFYVARGLTTPIKALAEGADEIAKGNLGHRVDVLAEDELALLVSAFNQMASRLESNSVELGERRKYIETILETLPTGVISFDPEGAISTINGAALAILRLHGADRVAGARLETVLTEENRTVIQRVVQRAKRTGRAADQTLFKHTGPGSSGSRPSTDLTVALTATKLPDEAGVVLVIEDLTELIAAQRASAWREVARRMAHEIKNPLTPIQLSAERIARRFAAVGHKDNGAGKRVSDKGPIAEVVGESTSTILREVTSLKTMVDEFSRFARLPDVVLEAGDLNEAIRQAAAVFEGHHAEISIRLELETAVPNVSIDTEQMKRVFVNLIQNSVEAFDADVADPRIVITTRSHVSRGLVVAEISDNGKGIPAQDLQKLFQPYFSTKGRGTGLGLAIVSRIIAEHDGRIKAVANKPRGAKFIIELPVDREG